MLIDPTDAHNMPMLVTALIVRLTDIVTVLPSPLLSGVCDADTIDIAARDIGTPYTVIAGGGAETFDDTNDAIAYAMRGDHNTYAAYRITANSNYNDDTFDLVIYSRVPITCNHFVGP